jgi:hypothetical protein
VRIDGDRAQKHHDIDTPYTGTGGSQGNGVKAIALAREVPKEEPGDWAIF